VSTDHPEALAARVAGAAAQGARPLIALDHDGTLSPIAPRPEDAVLTAGAESALLRLAVLADVVIISGRGLDDLVRRLGTLPLSFVSEHGLRWRSPDGTIEQLTPGLAPETLRELRTELDGLLAGRTGWFIEDKGVAIAVHHRLVPEDELHPQLEMVHSVLARAASLPGDGHGGADADGAAGGHVQTGKAVLELRPAGAEKGAALGRLSARWPLSRPIVMVGDDTTDEPALRVAEQLGGLGVLVATTPRPDAGTAMLSDPDAVVVFLGTLADHLSARATT
jgi:trehalose 6-phosphate phosphatase